MKIYVLDLKSFGIDNIVAAFKKAGNTVTVSSITLDDIRYSAAFNDFFAKHINNSFDMVFTFNFFPVISDCCNQYGIKYAAWVYDSPHISLYSYRVLNPCNYIFIFDREIFNELYSAGIKTVFYLPLAADIKRVQPANRFRCDVSFVGSMYNEPKHQLFKHFSKITDYTRGYLDGIINAQLRVYGYFMLEELLNDRIVKDLMASIEITPNSDGIETPEYVYANYFFARRVTSLERETLVNELSKICNFKLHSPNHQPVDYYDDMPSVFASSKINLNITLKSIKSGIPLRAFDIMSSCGFLLTNFQSEFLDYFVPDEDFVFYDSISDAVDKVQYYLKHDAEREEIAKNGYKKISENHTFDKRVELMMEIIQS